MLGSDVRGSTDRLKSAYIIAGPSSPTATTSLYWQDPFQIAFRVDLGCELGHITGRGVVCCQCPNCGTKHQADVIWNGWCNNSCDILTNKNNLRCKMVIIHFHTHFTHSKSANGECNCTIKILQYNRILFVKTTHFLLCHLLYFHIICLMFVHIIWTMTPQLFYNLHLLYIQYYSRYMPRSITLKNPWTVTLAWKI